MTNTNNRSLCSATLCCLLDGETVVDGSLTNIDPFDDRNEDDSESVRTDMAGLGQIMVEDEMVAECERLALVLGGPVGDIDADEILADTKHVFRWDVQRAINSITYSLVSEMHKFGF